MIRFGCPACGAVMEAPPQKAGQKVECLKCGQRLQIPAPPKGTILATSLPDPPAEGPRLPAVIPMPPAPPAQRKRRSGGDTAIPGPPRDDAAARQEDDGQGRHRQHSSLGIASFIIAVLVGGMDAALTFMIASNVAGTARAGGVAGLADPGFAGGVLSSVSVMACVNLLSIPLCLVGVGLGLVALIAHRDRDQLFSWVGLFCNGAVIVVVLAVWTYLSMNRPTRPDLDAPPRPRVPFFEGGPRRP